MGNQRSAAHCFGFGELSFIHRVLVLGFVRRLSVGGAFCLLAAALRYPFSCLISSSIRFGGSLRLFCPPTPGCCCLVLPCYLVVSIWARCYVCNEQWENDTNVLFMRLNAVWKFVTLFRKEVNRTHYLILPTTENATITECK